MWGVASGSQECGPPPLLQPAASGPETQRPTLAGRPGPARSRGVRCLRGPPQLVRPALSCQCGGTKKGCWAEPQPEPWPQAEAEAEGLAGHLITAGEGGPG